MDTKETLAEQFPYYLTLAGVAVAIVTTLLGGMIWIVKMTINSAKKSIPTIEKKVDNHIDWHMSYVDKE